MLAISSESREKKVEELELLKSYAEKYVTILNIGDDKFSKDTASEEVRKLLNKSPSFTFLKEDVAQINDIMNKFCNDEIDKDTALAWIISAFEEVDAMYKVYKKLGPLITFHIIY